MKRVNVGIDSSSGLDYTMVIAGSEGDINCLHSLMMNVLNKNGVKVPHFNEIDTDKVKSMSRSLIDVFKKAIRVSFVFFEHKRPIDKPKKQYYFEYIPSKIVEHLCDFDSKNRLIRIDIHDDYRIHSLNTNDFVDSVIRSLSRQMSRDDKGIKILEEEHYKVSKIRSRNNNYVKIRGCCVSRADSKSVNIADMSMGYFKNYSNLFSGKVRHRKI